MKTPTKKKVKVLLRKMGYLRLDIETKREELEEHERELNERLSQRSSPPPEDPGTELEPRVVSHGPAEQDETPAPDVSPAEVEAAPEDVKRLWKVIASKTHPDKTGGDPHLTEVYKEALSAFKRGALEEMLDIASELSVELVLDSPETLRYVQGRVKKLEEELSKLSGSVLWMWAEASEEKRAQIEQMLWEHRTKSRTKNPA